MLDYKGEVSEGHGGDDAGVPSFYEDINFQILK